MKRHAQPKDKRCHNCMAWEVYEDEDQNTGQCHKKAPSPQGGPPSGSGTSWATWPVTKGGDWCLEFQGGRLAAIGSSPAQET
jgi:hypothetical protein